MNDLSKEIQYVKGVGPAKAKALKTLGNSKIYTIKNLQQVFGDYLLINIIGVVVWQHSYMVSLKSSV